MAEQGMDNTMKKKHLCKRFKGDEMVEIMLTHVENGQGIWKPIGTQINIKPKHKISRLKHWQNKTGVGVCTTLSLS